MRLAIVSTPIFRLGSTGLVNYGGLEQIAWLCAKGLAEKGHEVFLVAPDGSECLGVSILPIGPERQVDERMAFERYKEHLPKMDCVIDHSWNKFAYLLKMEGKLKAPVLGVLHAPVNTMFQSPPPVEKPCIVCISEDQRSHYEALFGRDAKVCYNGVDGNIYKSLGIPRTDRFLFLARFSSIKGPDLGIQACKDAGVGLDLIGDTTITNEPEFFEKCKRMCDGKQIKLIGPCSRGETVYWYSQAHCMIHPNQRFRECFGLAPVESMLCGCPCISWKYGAMKETVREDWLVSSYEDLVKKIKLMASSDGPLYKDLTGRGLRKMIRERGEQFSIERMVNRYEELAKEAVETGGW